MAAEAYPLDLEEDYLAAEEVPRGPTGAPS